MEQTNKRLPYALWEVNGEEYKLKLTTSAITKIEEKYKTNLLNFIMDGGIPPVRVMLDITHAAMQKFNHGIKAKDVNELYDTYIDEGGSMTDFMMDVFIPIFNASGFFTEAQAEGMTDRLNEAKEQT